MSLFEDWRFIVNDVPFTIRKVGAPLGHSNMGHFVLFQHGRFKVRGTKRRCVEWAKRFAYEV